MKNKSMKKVLSLVVGAMSSFSFASGEPRPNNVVRSNRQNVRNKNSNGAKNANYGKNGRQRFSPAQYTKVRKYIRGRNIDPKRMTRKQIFEMSFCLGIPFFVIVLIIYAMCGSENGSLEQEKIGDISSKSGISDKSSEKGGSKSAAPAADGTKVDNSRKLEENEKKEITESEPEKVDVKLKNDYTSYISSDRVLLNGEVESLKELASKFNMIPFNYNNCYASTAMCMIADPRDIDSRCEQLENAKNLNFREREYKKFMDKLRGLMGNKDGKSKFLKSWMKKIKSLYRLPDEESGNLDGIYEEKYTYKQEDFANFLSGLFRESKMNMLYVNNPLMGNLLYLSILPNEGVPICNLKEWFSFGEREVEDEQGNVKIHPVTLFDAWNDLAILDVNNRLVSRLNDIYCLVDNVDSGDFLPNLNRKETYDPNNPKHAKLMGIKDVGGAFSVQTGGMDPSSESDPFGKVTLSKNGSHDIKKNYLVSDIAVQWGTRNVGHWYEYVVIYDKNTLNDEEPKVIALIRKDNLKSDMVITGKKLKSYLEEIAVRGRFYRYREISDDNKNVYSI